VRFGTYEVSLQSGEVRKAGLRIRVQQQPMKLLELLQERRGEVVTREELRSRVWPSESFGDFDQALNIAVGKLRRHWGTRLRNRASLRPFKNVVIALLRTCQLSMQTLAKEGRNPRIEI
jgi:DNA-binding winged helix-turn-helix (wHTH) protein